MMNNTNAYASYRTKQVELAKMIAQGSTFIKKLNMDNYSNALSVLSEKTNRDTLKIQVIGSFKNGKSTFINCFLGNEVLPAKAPPCTAVISEVKYGTQPKAVLHFKNPLPNPLPESIPQDMVRYLQSQKKGKVAPFEVAYDEIKRYVVIPKDEDQMEGVQDSAYEKMELYWPLDLLENGVEIIDSPGLNEAETRTRVTMEYLEKADAIVFVMSALAVCSKTEMDAIDGDIRSRGFEDIHFIINRFDQLNTPGERADVKEEVFNRLPKLTALGKEGIFFTSAYKGLLGKMENNREMLEQSGMVEFESSLSQFLVKEKGRLKLAQPAKELKKILNDEVLYKIIPQQEAMLNSSVDELKKNYQEVQPKLTAMESSKRQIVDRLSIKARKATLPVQCAISDYYDDVLSNVNTWVSEFKPQTKINLLKLKSASESVTNEIIDHVVKKMCEFQKSWEQATLNPMITNLVEEFMESEERQLGKFFDDMDGVRIDISGVTAQGKKTSVWERIGAGAVGWILTGNPLAGATGGFNKDFAKTIAVQLGAAFFLGLLGLFNPVTLIAIIIGGIIHGIFGNQNALVQKIKENLVTSIKEKIRASQIESTNKLIAGIQDKFAQIIETIGESMNCEIAELKKQTEEIILRMEQGKEECEKKRQELHQCERDLQKLNTQLDEFIFNLIQKA